MKGKIVEIFKSVQGEGKYAGLPQVFLRLSFCNLQCTYCDTDFVRGTWMDADEALREVQALLNQDANIRSISITGGEPLLQKEFLGNVLPRLKEQDLQILLETNGTLPDHLAGVLPWVDIVAMDIKLSSVSQTAEAWSEHRAFLSLSKTKETYVKVVLSRQTADEDFTRAVDLVAKEDPSTCFILQPVTPLGEASPPTQDQMNRWTALSTKVLRDVRVMPQMHKVWGLP